MFALVKFKCPPAAAIGKLNPSLSRVGRGGQLSGGAPSETPGGIPVAVDGRIFRFLR